MLFLRRSLVLIVRMLTLVAPTPAPGQTRALTVAPPPPVLTWMSTESLLVSVVVVSRGLEASGVQSGAL